MSHCNLAPSAALGLIAGFASAQAPQIHPFARTGDLLIGDSAGSKILRAHDLTTDGDYNDAGELTVYFDPAVAIDPNTLAPYGAAKLTNPAAMTMDLNGWVYVADAGSTRTMFRLRDLNGDGDANDAGESTVFFDATNAAALTNFAVQGVVAVSNGAISVSASGQGSGFTGIDRVIKLVDLNNDGDANDAGEQTVVYDRTTAVANGNTSLDAPAFLGTLPDGTLFMTNAFSSNQGLFRLADATPTQNGIYNDAGETTSVYTGANGNPAPKFTFCSRFGPDHKLYICNITDKKIIVAQDLTSNQIYDDPGEANVFASSGDGGITISALFGIEIRSDGTVILGDTGASPNNRLIGYKDNNSNGTGSDAGEQTVLCAFASSSFPTAKPRSLMFLPQEIASLGTGGVSSTALPLQFSIPASVGMSKLGNANFGMRVSNAPSTVLVGLFYSDGANPVSLDSIVPGVSDPSNILIPDITSVEFNGVTEPNPTDGFGVLNIPLPLPPVPILAGKVFTVQALIVDLSLTLPIVLSNALVIPFN